MSSSAYLYSTLGGDAELGELVEMFVAEMPQRMETLRTSLNSGRNGLRRIVHQVKGAAGSYGFPQITLAAAALELSLLDGEPEERVLCELEALLDLCNRARSGVPN